MAHATAGNEQVELVAFDAADVDHLNDHRLAVQGGGAGAVAVVARARELQLVAAAAGDAVVAAAKP